MPTVTVCYSLVEPEKMAVYFDRLLMAMPEQIQQKTLRYRHPKDRYLILAGKALLGEMLSSLKPPLSLKDIEMDRFGRPYIANIDSPVDFNISHSVCYAVCALSGQGRIGIDIERKRQVNLMGFKRHMTEAQWQDITSSEDSIGRFFYYWTMKESVLKADGRGMGLFLSGIETETETAVLDGRKWHAKELFIDPRYSCHLASATPIEGIRLVKREIEQLVQGMAVLTS